MSNSVKAEDTLGDLPLPVKSVLRARYELVDVVGRGGMSTVYSAIDRFRLRARSPNPLVAIKVLNVNPKIDAAAVELMHREARRMQEFQHPNVVRVYDWDQDGPVYFIIMELLQGRTLGAVFKERGEEPLARKTALEIVEAIGKGLIYAHEQGIVHTDLKPGNVFVTRAGEIKLLDFGLAHRHDPVPMLEGDEPTVMYFNQVGALTPAYASLEMLLGIQPTPADDVYSLGVITYMLLTGRHPFDRRTAKKAEAEGLRPIRPKGLGGRQWNALKKTLAFQRIDRTAYVDDFLEEFIPRGWLGRLFG